MKIIFMGTPQFAVPILEDLTKKHEVIMVVTQPDKKVGRKQILESSPVKKLAIELNIPVFQPVSLRESYQELLNLGADIIVTAAYGQMLPKKLLDRITALNVHGSLLPKYRGGAPIQYALFDCLEETGITIMYMAFKMDSGDIIKQGKVKIEENDNYQTLAEKLSQVGKTLLIEVLNDLSIGKIERTPQDEKEITFAYAIKREEEFLDFNKESKSVIGKVRGLSPDVGATIKINEQYIKVYDIEKSDIINMKPSEILCTKDELIIGTLDGSVKIKEIQPPGKRKMAIKEFLNGQRIFNTGDFIK